MGSAEMCVGVTTSGEAGAGEKGWCGMWAGEGGRLVCLSTCLSNRRGWLLGLLHSHTSCKQGWLRSVSARSHHVSRALAPTKALTSYISRSMARLPEEAAASSASATPSQAGSTRRVCGRQGWGGRAVSGLQARVEWDPQPAGQPPPAQQAGANTQAMPPSQPPTWVHAKIQGMARSEVTSWVALRLQQERGEQGVGGKSAVAAAAAAAGCAMSRHHQRSSILLQEQAEPPLVSPCGARTDVQVTQLLLRH